MKYEAGAAVNYISRQAALKKLQLSLKDFRRLCILKGIYPHEPAHKKKVNKGSTENRVWYYRKDINFLSHEPIISKFREYKIFLRRLNHYKAKKEKEKVRKLYANKPEYSLDRIVKERQGGFCRYPTFGSAIRDLDDALCLCFMFATLPHTRVLKEGLINASRRLTAEFMHYIIEAHALRNTFISIKGIYYQAEICGERVTWIVPHERGLPHITDVDFTVMVTFAEFYVTMLGFVNFRLYQMIGLYYPPQIQTGQKLITNDIDDEEHMEKVYSLARPLAKRNGAENENEVDVEMFGDDDNILAEKMKEANMIKTLFKGLVFFLNRETPREALTMIIRCCGGVVGWDGSPADLKESSSSITHQVVDRPMSKFDVNRRYIQPQWVFDCLNARRKLPTEKYMPGAKLPPHFSPFAKHKCGDYVPLERIEELRNLGQDVSDLLPTESVKPVKSKSKNTKRIEPESKGMKATLDKLKAMSIFLAFAIEDAGNDDEEEVQAGVS
ncbi:BRCA1 protein [Dictyocaulus viviparus]|uniref:Pescadillo homolog n=1 Tax=Dictyocaulus viviparus TaxID=29172 RepID=A0A0D8XKF1_DICVI|nr:BRCA1 protein [Dictyocaulus viviparus]